MVKFGIKKIKRPTIRETDGAQTNCIFFNELGMFSSLQMNSEVFYNNMNSEVVNE
jgi:hypothetical protein